MLVLCCLLLLPLVQLLTELLIYLLRSVIEFVQLSGLCVHRWLVVDLWLLLLWTVPLLIICSILLLRRHNVHTAARLLTLPLFEQILSIRLYLLILLTI